MIPLFDLIVIFLYLLYFLSAVWVFKLTTYLLLHLSTMLLLWY